MGQRGVDPVLVALGGRVGPLVRHAKELDIPGVEDGLDIGSLLRVFPEGLGGSAGPTAEKDGLGMLGEAGLRRVEGHALGDRAEEAVPDQEQIVSVGLLSVGNSGEQQ